MARSRIAHVTRRTLGATIRVTLDQVPKVTRHLPHHKRRARGLEIHEDVAYLDTGHPAHRLDVYRLADARAPSPALLYVHGGGFAACSKRTHVSLAVAYARLGFTVFNADYRLAPRHPYPAAFEDVAAALRWVHAAGATFGADSRRVVLAGESAGANLVAALAVAASYPLGAPRAASELYAAAPPIAAVLAGSGVYQVSDMGRLFRGDFAGPSIGRPLGLAMEEAYLGRRERRPGSTAFADPVLVLERHAPLRPLPPFFVFCGTDDFLLPDSERLAAALRRRGAEAELATYPGEPHAFHALRWRPAARACWDAQERFLAERAGLPVFGGVAAP